MVDAMHLGKRSNLGVEVTVLLKNEKPSTKP